MMRAGSAVRRAFTRSSGGSGPFIIDVVGVSAAAAYGLRRLRQAYSGAAVNIRRSSDNAAQDIGFVNGSLDTSALSAFVGGGSGLVTKWYDQSGNGNNAAQATAANQPSVSLSVIGGRPSLSFDGTNGFMDLASLFSGTAFSILTVCQTADVASIRNLYNARTASSDGFLSYTQASGGASNFDTLPSGSVTSSAIFTAGTPTIHEAATDGTNIVVGLNGATNTNATSTEVAPSTKLRIGGLTGSSGGNRWNGLIAELIVWQSFSVNRATARKSMGAYYGIATQ